MSSLENMTESPENTVSEPQEEEIKINRKKISITLVFGIIIMAVILCIMAVLYIPQVNNTVCRTFLSTEKYYQKVEKNFSEKTASKAGSGFLSAKTLFESKSNKSYEGKLKVNIDDQYAEGIGLSTIHNVGVNFNIGFEDKLGKYSSDILLNDEKLITLNQFANLKNNDVYVQIPELTDNYALLTGDYISGKSLGAVSAYNLLADESFSPDNIEGLINKYAEIFYSSAKNVSIEKNVKGATPELNYTYTALTVKFSEDEINGIADKLLTVMLNDSDTEKLFIDLGLCKTDEYDSFIQSFVTDLKALQDLTMKLWVNSNGDVVGREITSGSLKTGYLLAYDDKKFSLKAWLNKSDDSFSIDLGGTIKNKKLSGSGNINITKDSENTEAEFSFIDFEIISKDKGYSNGEFKVIVPQERIEISALLSGRQNGQNLGITVAGEDSDIADIEFDVAEKGDTSEEIMLPVNNVFDINTDMSGYKANIDFMKFLTIMGGKADFEGIIKDIFGTEAINYTEPDNEADYENYDDDYDYQEPNYVDLAKSRISMNELDLGFPIKAKDFADKINLDGTIGKFDYAYFVNNEKNVQIRIDNYEDLIISAIDGDVTSINISGSGKELYDLKINDIGIGSPKEAITSAFGEPTYNEQNNEVTNYIYSDINNGIEIQFYVKNGVVTEIIYSVI